MTCVVCSQDRKNEVGSSDGPVKASRFKQPLGICVEFGSVVYIHHAQTNSIKIFAKLKECSVSQSN